MFETPITPSVTTEELLDARKKFEAEKLTRRAALKKFGITTGMAVFGMFAADDLARMVIKKMEETEATRQIAETVAHEFKNSGIAFADTPPPGCDHTISGNGLGGGPGKCNVSAIGANCSATYPNDTVACTNCVTRICHTCACGDVTGVPCQDAGCNTYCYSTAVSACSSS